MSASTPLSIAAEVLRWHAPYGLTGKPLGIGALAPVGATIGAGDAWWIAPSGLDDPSSPSALQSLLPDPLAVPGALVVVGPGADRGLFARLLRPREPIARAVRGSALLLRGFHSIGGGVDPASGLDLAWGRAP